MKWGDAPGWTIEQAMQAMSTLGKAFRSKGYSLALHGSVIEKGKGNDLDLIAIPAELAVPPPEEMERLLCTLLDAKPVSAAPREGLLRTWSRACVLEDGRQIDMEYRRPLPIDPLGATISSLAKTFWDHGYHLEVHCYAGGQGERHDLELLAVPARMAPTPPEDMERLMCELLDAKPVAEKPRKSLLRTWSRACVCRDGYKIDMQYRICIEADESPV